MKTTFKTVKRTHKTHTGNGSTRLDERAMLVYLSIGLWAGRKIDQELTSQVTKAARAEADAGKWWTRVVPAHATKPIVNARMRARHIHFECTLPWQDNGVRVLPSSMFLDYSQKMRKAEEEFRKAVVVFLKEYPTYVADASIRLGTLFKPELFPTAEAISDKFPWSIHYSPLPTAGDFRVDLGEDTTAEIRKGIQDQADAAMADAMSDLWQRLHDGVSKIAERLNDPDGIFRDSLIENVTELCELLPKMNVTGNKDLEKARQDVVKKLSKQEPEVLRKNKPARADAAKQAADILKQMETYMSKRSTK